MIQDLYSGEELCSWLYISDKLEQNDIRFVNVQFYQNGVSLEIPLDIFNKVVEEMIKSARALSVLESRN